MDYLIAVFLPCVVLLFKGRYLVAIALFIAQCTVIGWPVATLVAWLVISEENRKRDLENAVTPYKL